MHIDFKVPEFQLFLASEQGIDLTEFRLEQIGAYF